MNIIHRQNTVFLILNIFIYEVTARLWKVNIPGLQMKLHRKTGGPFWQHEHISHIRSNNQSTYSLHPLHILNSWPSYGPADKNTEHVTCSQKGHRICTLKNPIYIYLHKKDNILTDEQTVEDQSLSIWNYIPTPVTNMNTAGYRPIGTASLVSNM